MRADPGLTIQEAVIATMSLEARNAERLRLRTRAVLMAWQMADSAGPMTELERAEFLLRRLHPTLPRAALRQIMRQLESAHLAGEWHGFRRPEPLPIR